LYFPSSQIIGLLVVRSPFLRKVTVLDEDYSFEPEPWFEELIQLVGVHIVHDKLSYFNEDSDGQDEYSSQESDDDSDEGNL
jgi:hypothetical protein